MTRTTIRLLALCVGVPALLGAQTTPDPRLDRLKTEVARAIDAKAKLTQQMVDQVFSFGELGMQEIETSKYLVGILEQNGFAVERGVPRRDAEVLLRPVELRDVSPAARGEVSDGTRNRAVSNATSVAV
jgi:hypothetical protein